MNVVIFLLRNQFAYLKLELAYPLCSLCQGKEVI